MSVFACIIQMQKKDAGEEELQFYSWFVTEEEGTGNCFLFQFGGKQQFFGCASVGSYSTFSLGRNAWLGFCLWGKKKKMY